MSAVITFTSWTGIETTDICRLVQRRSVCLQAKSLMQWGGGSTVYVVDSFVGHLMTFSLVLEGCNGSTVCLPFALFVSLDLCPPVSLSVPDIVHLLEDTDQLVPVPVDPTLLCSLLGSPSRAQCQPQTLCVSISHVP